MTIASCFIQEDGPPVFLTDVLVTMKDEGEFTQLYKRWHNQSSPPSMNFREVMHIRKVHVIKNNYCIVWAADDISAALEAISNLENIIEYYPPEKLVEQITKFFKSISEADPYSIILVEVFSAELKFKHRFWGVNTRKFDLLDVTGLISGSGAELISKGEISVPTPDSVKGSALNYAILAMIKCLANEVTSNKFIDYKMGAYYELTVWDGGWKSLSVPINLVEVNEIEGNRSFRFLSYSRIIYNEIAPLCVSMDPLEFLVEGDASKIVSSVLIDPFRDKNKTSLSFDLISKLKEASPINITLLFDGEDFRWVNHSEPLIDFSRQQPKEYADGFLNYEMAKNVLRI